MDIKNINDIKVPYIIKNNKEYYPLRYFLEKVLLRNKAQLYKNKIYRDHIINIEFDFSFNGGGVQNTYCIDKEGLILFLKRVKTGNFNVDINKRYETICDYFEINSKKYLEIDNYNEYILDCINEFKLNNKSYKRLLCKKCKREFPLDEKFFTIDRRNKNGFSNYCRECRKNSVMLMNDKNKIYSYYNFGIKGYSALKNNFIKYYKDFIHKNDSDLKFQIRSEHEYLSIVKYFYDNNLISKDNLKHSFIKSEFKFYSIAKFIKSDSELNIYCSKGECIYRPYKYPNYKNGEINYEVGFKIFKNYIDDNKIMITNKLEYNNYFELIRKSRLNELVCKNNNILDFIVSFYNNKYAGYKFKYASRTYYDKKENRIFDMKWFIEKDLKIPIEKIPLYVTKNSLASKARTLYTLLRSGKYYNNLFEWINECYPHMFIESDFDINPFRSKFDSLEEAQIDDILKKNFDNVIYNQRNSDFEININNNVPDWTIFTNNGVYLVEYFGLYQNNIGSSSRLKEYKIKMDKKFKKYNEVSGYKFLFIYPEDIRYNYNGLKNKIQKIKES